MFVYTTYVPGKAIMTPMSIIWSNGKLSSSLSGLLYQGRNLFIDKVLKRKQSNFKTRRQHVRFNSTHNNGDTNGQLNVHSVERRVIAVINSWNLFQVFQQRSFLLPAGTFAKLTALFVLFCLPCRFINATATTTPPSANYP